MDCDTAYRWSYLSYKYVLFICKSIRERFIGLCELAGILVHLEVQLPSCIGESAGQLVLFLVQFSGNFYLGFGVTYLASVARLSYILSLSESLLSNLARRGGVKLSRADVSLVPTCQHNLLYWIS